MPTASHPSLEHKLGLCSERPETNHLGHGKSNCIRATPWVCIWEEKQMPKQCMLWGSSSLWYQMGVSSQLSMYLCHTNPYKWNSLNTSSCSEYNGREKVQHLPESETTNSITLLVTLVTSNSIPNNFWAKVQNFEHPLILYCTQVILLSVKFLRLQSLCVLPPRLMYLIR